MNDPVVMFHPANPLATTVVEREAYRTVWYLQGWRSFDDPYEANPTYGSGYELDYSPIVTDKTAFSATGEVIAAADRITVPKLAQPIYLEASFQVASVSGTNTFGFGFVRASQPGNVLAYKGVRQYVNVPTAAAGVGIPVLIKYRIPPETDAADWTIGGTRDAGSGQGQVRANPLAEGYFRAITA